MYITYCRRVLECNQSVFINCVIFLNLPVVLIPQHFQKEGPTLMLNQIPQLSTQDGQIMETLQHAYTQCMSIDVHHTW